MRAVRRVWRPRTRRQGAVAAVALGGILVVASAVLVGPPGPVGPASPTPPASHRASASPSTAPAAWSSLDLEPFADVASLEPTVSDGAGVAVDSAFTLTSLAGDDPTDLAGRLEVSPTTAYAVTVLDDRATVRIQPSAPLVAGELYRFVLRAPDGSLEGSWAFSTRSALRVESTIPGERTTYVPRNAGIEVTFDQPGAGAMDAYFTIEPSVTGRFERHGRTQVFVPAKLEPATLYTVTIRSGVPLDGAPDLAMEADYVFRFETEAASGTGDDWYRFGRDVVEVSPVEPPILAIQPVDPSGNGPPATPAKVSVTVYRLPSLSAATTVLRGYLDAPRWTNWTDPRMQTVGLPVAQRFEAQPEPIADSDERILRFPARLAVGWYIVEVAGTRPAQAFLQVSPVSAWVTVAVDRTVVWANDTATGGPIAGATAEVVGGSQLGAADRDGLLLAATPAALLPPAEIGKADRRDPGPIMVVRAPSGQAVLVPFHLPTYGSAYRGEWWSGNQMVDDSSWSLLFTDRSLFRKDDTVAVWGYVRDRTNGRVPATVELRVIRQDAAELVNPPVIARASTSPDAVGAFNRSLTLDGVPLGGYLVQAVVDGRVATAAWIQVTVIRKPTYQLSITPDRYAVISGTVVPATLEARFFDGQPAPTIALRVYQDPAEALATTDRSGRARINLTPRIESNSEGSSGWSAYVTPARAEAAPADAYIGLLVFPAGVHLDGSGTVIGTRLAYAGALHHVDLARLDREVAAGDWSGDPAGAPVAGRVVHAVVTELVPVRRQVGTEYDFINKVVTPRYEYVIQRKAVGSYDVTTGSDGSFTLSTTVPDGEHQYEVILTARDGPGRTEKRTTYAGKPWSDPAQDWIRFQTTVGADDEDRGYRIGDTIELTMTDGQQALPTGGSNRYLYLVSQRGLRSARVADVPRFSARFEASDAPGVFIIGVRFTGRTYAPKADMWANFDTSARALTVVITSDRERYRPGDQATFSIRTTDPAGRGVAANVAVRGVDEKLFAIGGASEIDPLSSLYHRLDSGIVRITATHQLPLSSGPEGEGGDTTGGGDDRADFRDTLFFKAVTTDAQGRASVSAKLLDDLTSWHVSATALTAGLQAGEGQLVIPVGLPLFVEATIADEYLVADHPVIRLRAFGEALSDGDPVEFSVLGPSLGLERTGIKGRAFVDVDVALPDLVRGTHAITIQVTSPSRRDEKGLPRVDRLVRTVDVVASRVSSTQTAYSVLDPSGGDLALPPGGDLTMYTFTDAGRGRWLPIVETLAAQESGRLDRTLARVVAHDLLVDVFGRDPVSVPPAAFDPADYGIRGTSDGGAQGMPLIPWGGPDVRLTALVAIVRAESFNADELLNSLVWTRDSEKSSRELRLAAVAGLAALGEPVTRDLASAAALGDLTIAERLYVALGYAALGDEGTARRIERDLLGAQGERLGAWARLRVGDDPVATAEATALAALLAARIGDPIAGSLIAYLIDDPASGAVHDLEVAGAVRAVLARTPAAAATFAYTVDGRRTVVVLDPGEAMSVSLTETQRAGMRVQPLDGQLALVMTWTAPVATAALHPSADLTLTRTVPPSPFSADREVMVELTATFRSSAPRSGCYEMVEVVPSGLAPLPGWFGNEPDGSWTPPSSVIGQEVRFCVENDPRLGGVARMRYLARIVTPGAYVWESAIMQLAGAPELLAFTPTTRIEIRDP